MVAAKSPVRTQDWPVLGKPSQPVKGSFSQRSRSDSFVNSSKAFLAPTAMESSCAPTKSTAALCEVLSFSKERTARCALFGRGILCGPLNIEDRTAMRQQSGKLTALNPANFEMVGSHAENRSGG